MGHLLVMVFQRQKLSLIVKSKGLRMKTILMKCRFRALAQTLNWNHLSWTIMVMNINLY